MGTNYYVTLPSTEDEEEPIKLHIGKSSSGWVFALRTYPESVDKPKTLADWRKLLKANELTIEDEYGNRLNYASMLGRIIDRPPFSNQLTESEFSWVDKNLNLKRPKIAAYGERHMKHAKGTYTLYGFEFS